MTTATTQLTAEEMQKLAQDIIERLKANEGRVCMADTRDLRKIAGTWNN
jgi:predicted RNA-binding protein (virulence factor B family)